MHAVGMCSLATCILSSTLERRGADGNFYYARQLHRTSSEGRVDNPDDRANAVAGLMVSVGAKLLQYYVTTGEYGFLVISEGNSMIGTAACSHILPLAGFSLVFGSYPTLDGISQVGWACVKANLRGWRSLMDNVYQFFKQIKLFRIVPDSGPDENAIVGIIT